MKSKTKTKQKTRFHWAMIFRPHKHASLSPDRVIGFMCQQHCFTCILNVLASLQNGCFNRQGKKVIKGVLVLLLLQTERSFLFTGIF